MAEKQDKFNLPAGVTAGTKEAMLLALEKAMGIVSTAGRLAGVARSTHYYWMKEDIDYADKVDELVNVAIDFAESKLHQKIQGGDTTSIIFFLKTKGKDRGYVERIETVKKQIHVKLNRKEDAGHHQPNH